MARIATVLVVSSGFVISLFSFADRAFTSCQVYHTLTPFRPRLRPSLVIPVSQSGFVVCAPCPEICQGGTGLGQPDSIKQPECLILLVRVSIVLAVCYSECLSF